jgi:hypothetical protein
MTSSSTLRAVASDFLLATSMLASSPNPQTTLQATSQSYTQLVLLANLLAFPAITPYTTPLACHDDITLAIAQETTTACPRATPRFMNRVTTLITSIVTCKGTPRGMQSYNHYSSQYCSHSSIHSSDPPSIFSFSYSNCIF